MAKRKSNITKTSRINRTKQNKVSSLVARMALMIAARENPSNYKRYMTMRKKYLELKRGLLKKYSPKATMAVREIIKRSRSKKK